MPTDDLNRTSLAALMKACGIDGASELARRMKRAATDDPTLRSFERSYVSRVVAGQRPAHPSFIVACARVLQVPTVAITGNGLTEDDLEAVAS